MVKKIIFTILIAGIIIPLHSRNNKLTKIILVRHAEKIRDGSANPSLTTAGQKRALEIVYILKYIHLDAIYSTPYLRNQETVSPLADDRGIKITNYKPGEEKIFLSKVLEKFRGGTVLIAGHSNTIPAMLNVLLGKKVYKDLAEKNYDNIFIVSAFAGGETDITHLRFGEHSNINQ